MVQRQNKWVETLLVAAFISSAISPVRGFSVCPVGLRGKGLHLPHGVGQHAGAAGRAGHRSPLLMQVTEKDTFVRPSARGKRDIVFGTSVTTSCPVAPKHDEGFNLSAYMQLPTDQYVLIPLPNNAKLEKKGENLFTLRVPELQIFNVWLRPHVVSSVDVSPNGVVIEAVECRLDGSAEVQRLGLNDLFELEVKVVLQGSEDPRGLRSMMTARSEICVWVDAPQIFRVLFPRPIMVETGTAVLRSTLRLLQTTFLQGLASDYNRWAVDSQYRAERTARR